MERPDGRRKPSLGTQSVLSAAALLVALVGVSARHLFTCPQPSPSLPPAQESSAAILGRLRSALERKDRASVPTLLARLPTDDGESHFKAAAMLVEAEEYAAAAKEFGIARRTYRDAYIAGYDQALAYVKAGDYASAISTANELLSQGHETAELADVAATAYLKSGQTKQAYNALRLATKLDPQDEDAYVDLSNLCLDDEKYDLGLEIATIGLSHLPKSQRLYLQRGVMRAMKGEFSGAEEDFSSALKLAPQEVLPSVALGLVSMQRGHLDQAVEVLRRAAKQHPDSYLAQYWFAKVLLQSGVAPRTKDGDEILAALEASVKSNPDFWHSRTDLGKLLLERGEVGPAIAELEKAVALNPNATSPLYLLAQAYRRQGDDARASDLMARVSKMQAQERENLPAMSLKQIVREGTTGEHPGNH
jgi:Flp pilus assembly protein TadD